MTVEPDGVVLHAQRRSELGEDAELRLVRSGRLPGELVGASGVVTAIVIDHAHMREVFRDPAVRALPFTLVVDGHAVVARVGEIRRDPERRTAVHVQFIALAAELPVGDRAPSART